MTINEIINFIMTSPENTNPNILKDMLESLENNSENDDNNDNILIVNYNNYTLDKTWQEIFDADFAVIKEDDGLADK